MNASEEARLARRWNCRLTTVGRRSGKPRAATIWFVLEGKTVFLTGGREVPHWWRNVRASGEVTLELGGQRFRGRAKVVEEPLEAAAIRERFVQKYWLARIARWFGGYTRSVAARVELAPADGPSPEMRARARPSS